MTPMIQKTGGRGLARLGLTPRTLSCLRKGRCYEGEDRPIVTLKDLLESPPRDLLRISWIGKGSLKEIMEKCPAYRRRWAQEWVKP